MPRQSSLYRLLRSSERYFKTDMVYLAKGGSWLVLSQTLTALTAFVMSIAYANLLTQQVYGSYKFVLSVASILGSFSLTGLGTVVVQAVARGQKGFLRFAFRKNLYWSFPISIAALGAAIYYSFAGNAMLAFAMVLIAVFTPLINSTGLYSAFLGGIKDFKTSVLYWLFSNTVVSMVLLVTMVMSDALLPMVLAYFISMAAVGIAVYWRTVRRFAIKKEKKTYSLNYSKHLSIINLFNTLASHIDKVLVFHYLGATHTAVYLFALAIPDQLKGLFKIIPRMALPKFASRPLREIKIVFFSKMAKFALVMLVVVVAYAVAAPYIFDFFFPQYHDSIVLTQVLAFSLFGALVYVPVAALEAHSQKRQLYKFSVVTNVLQIVVSVALIKYFGLIGAVVAHLLMKFIGVIVASSLLYTAKDTSHTSNASS